MEIRERRRGFLWINTEILDNYTAKIGPVGLLVYVFLARYASNERSECWPKQALLAELCGCSERSIRSTLTQLKSLGLIEIERRKLSKGMTSETQNVYTLLSIPTGNPLPDGGVPIGKIGGGQPAPGFRCNKEELDLRTINILSPPSEDEGSKNQPTPPSKKNAENIRYQEFVAALDAGYKRKGWPFSFNAAAGKQLKSLLSSRPSLTVEIFRIWLGNYFKSDGVIPGDMPHVYLASLPRYWKAPLNRFGKIDASQTQKVAMVEENMQ